MLETAPSLDGTCPDATRQYSTDSLRDEAPVDEITKIPIVIAAFL